jgi:CBS domain-containing protein
MKIKDIMTKDVISVGPNDSISKVSDILFQNRFHGLPVVEGKKVVGIITEDDFFLKNYDDLYLPSYIRFIKENRIADNLPKETQEKIKRLLGAQVKDLMTANPLAISMETEIPEFMNLIKKTKFTTFPVVDENKDLAGIVTLADVLGTVREGSREMKKAFKGNKEIEGLAKELDNEWRDKLIVVSKKKVRTWKGATFIFIFAALGAGVLLIANINSKNSCELERKNVYPLECQKITYSDWSSCRVDGTQTRELIEKLPKNCEGGSVPELVRPCE